MRICVMGLVLLICAAPVLAGRPMTVDDLLAVKGVGGPQLSPDGALVVYVVSEIDRATNKTNSALWLVPVAGGEPRQLTTSPGTNDHPRWSPDGKTIAFVSNRGGSSQVWLLPLSGGEARQLTKLPIDVAGPIWSPKGDKIVFAAKVFPGTSPADTAKLDKAKAEEKGKAQVYDHLLFRHWTEWDNGKRSHLFVCDAQTGESRDLMPGLAENVPPAPFGGSSDYAISPDGQEIAYVAEPAQDAAWSTNTDIWTMPISGGQPKNLTEKNKGADAQPAYSPDGEWLAYVSQERAGFEADQWVLWLLDRERQTAVPVTKALDRPVHSFIWDQSIRFLMVIDDAGTEPIVGTPLAVDAHGKLVVSSPPREIPRLVTGGVNNAIQLSSDGKSLVYIHHDAQHPAEVFKADADGKNVTPLTHHNAKLLEQLDLPKGESFTFKGADGDPVQGWLFKPPGFDPAKKYPVLFLIHGGPQGAWHDEWHSRWNYAMFGAPGYALVAINPRGSTGFGQKFTDQISGDWSGRVYDDLMAGLDHALKTYSFLDGDHVAAAGGSYGGYMVNWICGHTDRFKALISHAGVFDLVSEYGATEELWFPEWEFGGAPWEHPELYRELSPSSYVENFKTPTLVIQGALDFRVPDGQGLGMFTSLQRKGVPSRLVFFPDEGHWVAKPANRVIWWGEVHAWFDKYLHAKP